MTVLSDITSTMIALYSFLWRAYVRNAEKTVDSAGVRRRLPDIRHTYILAHGKYCKFSNVNNTPTCAAQLSRFQKWVVTRRPENMSLTSKKQGYDSS